MRLRKMMLMIGASGLIASTASQAAETVQVQRLAWAGVRFQGERTTLLVDPLVTDIWDGDNPGELVPIGVDTPRCHVLVTHLHNDHYDRAALARLLGDRGRVLCLRSEATYVASDGFRVRPVDLDVPVQVGEFMVTAVPAVDGFGDPQVSWVIESGGTKYLHAGDTLWHGSWNRIASTHGPFDAAFLPVNGFLANWETPASGVAKSLTPIQAVAAARILGAARLIPIHYGYSTAMYEEYPEALTRLREEAAEHELTLEVLEPGAWLEGHP